MAAEASTIAFDTLKAVRRLEGAGMARGHAEAVAETVAAAQGSAATKEDIRRLEDKMATKEDLAKLEANIANLEIRLVRAMLVQAGAIVAIIVALLKFLQ